MDAYEATQVVFARVQAHDPENVSKIIGFLLLQDQNMARLALGSDSLLQSAIARARRELGIIGGNQAVAAAELPQRRPSPLFIPESGGAQMFNASSPHFPHLEEPDAPLPMMHTHHPHHHHHAANAQKRHLQELAMALACKPCLYYSRGYCKHGSSCRFLHGSSSPSSSAGSAACAHCFEEDQIQLHQQQQQFPGFCSPGSSSTSSNSSACSGSAASLERLELELQELLRARRTPVSIASLPQLYFERYGKALQAQGYLTESQRHGKAGCSLTKLLSRLKGSVALIDRPHGQHAVVLAEEANRYLGYKADRDDLKDVNPSSRQIYLTFPAESTFTEEDVSAHFKAYGPVQDVRIPYQQKRMFGFVTFVFIETVRTILAEGNPHYICGARVLVKPYREKLKIGERKPEKLVDLTTRLAPPQFRSSLSGKNFFMQDAGMNNFYDGFARGFEEEQRILELERRRLIEFQRLESIRARAAEAEAAAAAKILMEEQERINSPEIPRTPQISEQQLHSGFNSNELDDSALTSEDMNQFQSSNPFGFVMDVLESEGGEIEAENGMKQRSELPPLKNDVHHNLPESPFASSDSGAPGEIHQATNLSLQEKLMGLNLNEVFGMASSSHNEIVCCICLQRCVEPSTLDCSHTFCVQCILKVIRGSKDECPICRQHIGSQVYKILQNRDLQSWLSPTLSMNRVPQHIW